MIYVGIDIAKKAHEICFLDESGSILGGNSFKISNTASGMEKLKAKMELCGVTPDNAVVGMEATGHYWMVLHAFLLELGFDVKVINPLVTDAYRGMLIRRSKNDRIDALVVAKVLKLGEYVEAPVHDEETLSLRHLCRFRLWQVDTCSDLKRKAIGLLDQVFPEYETLFSNVFGKTSKEILRSYTTPEELLAVSSKKLIKILHKASKGRFGEDKALELKETARKSIGLRFSIDAFAFQIRQVIEQIEFIEEQIQQVDAEITQYMEQMDTYITSIPGVGAVYGAVIVSEIGDVSRFKEGKQLVSYAGLDASVSESGEFKGTQSHMSKRGSAYLRKAIFGAALVASWSDPELSKYYHSLRERGKHHLVAVGAVSRKLCYYIHAVLSENRPFEKRGETLKA